METGRLSPGHFHVWALGPNPVDYIPYPFIGPICRSLASCSLPDTRDSCRLLQTRQFFSRESLFDRYHKDKLYLSHMQ